MDSLGWLGVEHTASKPIVNKKPCCSAPRWRNRAVLSFMNKDMGHKFDLIVHNTPSTFVTKDGQTLKKETLDEINKLRKKDKKTEFTLEDYSFRYHWELDLRGAFTLTKNLGLVVKVSNILGFDRPSYNKEALNPGAAQPVSEVYNNPRLYSREGRSIDLRLTYNF